MQPAQVSRSSGRLGGSASSVAIAAETSRRFGENWKILLEGRGYIPQGNNILEFFRNDSQIQIDIEYHY